MKDRREVVVVASRSSESSSASSATQLSANSSLDSIKAMHSVFSAALCVSLRHLRHKQDLTQSMQRYAEGRREKIYLFNPLAVDFCLSFQPGNSSLTTGPGNVLNPFSQSS